MFRKVSFAVITSLLTVGLGRTPRVLTSPIGPWVALTLVPCRWVSSRHPRRQMWAARRTQQCSAEPGAVGISPPATPWHGGRWGVNTLLSLGLQPRLPPRGPSGLRIKEEMAAFMRILLSHHRPSSFFLFFKFFFLKTWWFRTLLLVLLLSSPAERARIDDSEIAKNITLSTATIRRLA